jgi:hypothetical protein
MQAYGPAITWLMSRTLTPARGSGRSFIHYSLDQR